MCFSVARREEAQAHGDLADPAPSLDLLDPWLRPRALISIVGSFRASASSRRRVEEESRHRHRRTVARHRQEGWEVPLCCPWA